MKSTPISTRNSLSDGLPDPGRSPAIHIDQIERYGGIHSVRDPGLLESALFRTQTRYYADLLRTAALWESLSQNHPFLDGDKRIAFAAT